MADVANSVAIEIKPITKENFPELIEIYGQGLASESNEIWTLQSGIFAENQNSIRLHEKCGFRIVGYREKIGKKDGVWKYTVLMECRSKITGIN